MSLVIDDERPWENTHEAIRAPYLPTADKDAIVTEIELSIDPATISYQVSVGSLRFWSKIEYHSIEDWSFLSVRGPKILSCLVAWDAMRFLALGGERLVLPAILRLDDEIKAAWHTCFLRQFSEWRFRNLVQYGAGYPQLDSDVSDSPILVLPKSHQKHRSQNQMNKPQLNDGSLPMAVAKTRSSACSYSTN